ncbi:MAG TPA: hypothetical protein VFQ61_06470 [Polyangiaceae bacterium]|nr:hypothetical protein [Polyangiaceae bacterium]
MHAKARVDRVELALIEVLGALAGLIERGSEAPVEELRGIVTRALGEIDLSWEGLTAYARVREKLSTLPNNDSRVRVLRAVAILLGVEE